MANKITRALVYNSKGNELLSEFQIDANSVFLSGINSRVYSAISKANGKKYLIKNSSICEVIAEMLFYTISSLLNVKQMERLIVINNKKNALFNSDYLVAICQLVNGRNCQKEDFETAENKEDYTSILAVKTFLGNTEKVKFTISEGYIYCCENEHSFVSDNFLDLMYHREIALGLIGEKVYNSSVDSVFERSNNVDLLYRRMQKIISEYQKFLTIEQFEDYKLKLKQLSLLTSFKINKVIEPIKNVYGIEVSDCIDSYGVSAILAIKKCIQEFC